MTVAQAIRAVRMILDEPKYEYFGQSTDLDTEFREALEAAAAQVAREMHLRGEKEAVRPIYVEESVLITGGNRVQPTLPYLEICEVWSNWDLDLGTVAPGSIFRMRHAFVPPQEFHRRQWRATTSSATPAAGIPASETHIGRLEYTIDSDDILVNRDQTILYENDTVTITYLAVPTVSLTGTDPMPLGVHIHGYICDVAAEIMYRKEHPGENRQMVGGMVDLEGALLIAAQKGPGA